jgi:NAD(P)-dependent dehydrogenase (short-subunit alcohol dehydrogenase family)
MQLSYGSATADAILTLEGQTAVVIGGTGVLGSAIAEGLLASGARVIISGRNIASGTALVESWNEQSDASHSAFVRADATSRTDLEHLLHRARELYEDIDILVNAAGINDGTPFFDVSGEDWDRIMDVNVKSVFLTCQVFGRYLVERGKGGSIINIGSMAGMTPLSRVFAYSASKAAVMNLTQNLAREWAPDRIRVNCIAPGFFPAEQNRQILSEDRIEAILSHTPMGRFGDAHEVVGAALFLASERASSFVTGTTIPVDGGFSSSTI